MIKNVRTAGGDTTSLEIQLQELLKKANPNKFGAKAGKTKDNQGVPSGFQGTVYNRLLDEGIRFLHEHKAVVLEPFYVHGKKVNGINARIDFMVEGFAFTEVKGGKATMTENFRNKWKLLQYKYGDDYEYHIIKNETDLDNFVQRIKKWKEA